MESLELNIKRLNCEIVEFLHLDSFIKICASACESLHFIQFMRGSKSLSFKSGSLLNNFSSKKLFNISATSQ
jgi:hypothetical protein